MNDMNYNLYEGEVKNDKVVDLQPLIDADGLVYGAAFAAQYENENGVLVSRPFSYVEKYIDEYFRRIKEELFTDREPILFLGSNKMLAEAFNTINRNKGLGEKEYRPNFRHDIATLHVYKENRADTVKPIYYDDVRLYLITNYNCILSDWLETDDHLALVQESNERTGYKFDKEKDMYVRTVIVSQDKDLLIQRGLHYTPAVGSNPSKPLREISYRGQLTCTIKNEKGTKKITGDGIKFFFWQLFTGDSTDNIMGCGVKTKVTNKRTGVVTERRKGIGAVTAYETLKDLNKPSDMAKAVTEKYKEIFGAKWEDAINENGRLLMMVNSRNKDGSYKMFDIQEFLNGKYDNK